MKNFNHLIIRDFINYLEFKGVGPDELRTAYFILRGYDDYISDNNFMLEHMSYDDILRFADEYAGRAENAKPSASDILKLLRELNSYISELTYFYKDPFSAADAGYATACKETGGKREKKLTRAYLSLIVSRIDPTDAEKLECAIAILLISVTNLTDPEIADLRVSDLNGHYSEIYARGENERTVVISETLSNLLKAYVMRRSLKPDDRIFSLDPSKSPAESVDELLRRAAGDDDPPLTADIIRRLK